VSCREDDGIAFHMWFSDASSTPYGFIQAEFLQAGELIIITALTVCHTISATQNPHIHTELNVRHSVSHSEPT